MNRSYWISRKTCRVFLLLAKFVLKHNKVVLYFCKKFPPCYKDVLFNDLWRHLHALARIVTYSFNCILWCIMGHDFSVIWWVHPSNLYFSWLFGSGKSYHQIWMAITTGMLTKGDIGGYPPDVKFSLIFFSLFSNFFSWALNPKP